MPKRLRQGPRAIHNRRSGRSRAQLLTQQHVRVGLRRQPPSARAGNCSVGPAHVHLTSSAQSNAGYVSRLTHFRYDLGTGNTERSVECSHNGERIGSVRCSEQRPDLTTLRVLKHRPDASTNLGNCEGNCNQDSDCAGNLVCHAGPSTSAQSYTGAVSGCFTGA